MPGALDVGRRAAANAARAVRQLVARAVLPPRRGMWLALRVTPRLEELRAPALPFASAPPPSLLECLQTLACAARDPQVDGVLLRLDGAPRGWSKVLALRRGIEALRAAGKPVVAYADGLGDQDLLLASAASHIWLPEAGSVAALGLRAQSFFARELLGRLNVQPDVVRVGRYKAAAESLTRESMSPENREQMEAVLDDLFEALVDGIARGRGLPPGRVRALIDGGPLRAPAAVEAGLVDACLYADEIEERLEALTPLPPPERDGARRVRLVDASVYHALRAADPGWRPLLHDLPHIAYIVASGMIHRGRGPRGIASDRLRELLEQARRDVGVRGVVLRIDSPGGDGLASDLLWRAVERARRDKPVVVSMGDVAASGGYYVATAAEAVFAEAVTLTGSIGVVGGKLDLSGLLERLGVVEEAIERGARAGMLSGVRGFSTDERALVRREMESFYALFLERVARGRGLAAETVASCAEGRVWTGLRAQHLGLVDALGGPLEALREACRRAGLAEGERFVLEVHPRLPALGGLTGVLGLWSARRGGSAS